MNKIVLILMLFSVSVSLGQQNSPKKLANEKTTEEMIRRLDDEERQAALDRNVAALERLWSNDFTVNAPNNAVSAGKKAVMETFVKSGVINFSSYERKIEFVRVDGDYVFVFGLETLIPKTDAPAAGLVAGQTIQRRYTNIWKNEAGTWRLFARHANVISPTTSNAQNDEAEVRKVIEKYFAAFNTHSAQINTEITTEDWYHINPAGGWTRGRDETMKLLGEVHSSFLKNVTMRLEDSDIRFATPTVAVVTVTNSIDNYTLPNGEKHENERQIKTIVVVKRGGKWLIMQDQNTIVR